MRGLLQTASRAARIGFSGSRRIAIGSISNRLTGASFLRLNSTTPSEKLADQSSLPDNLALEEDIDEWIKAVKNLREEFTSNGRPYDPETSLVAPGESKVDLKSVEFNRWEPTEAQLNEATLLKVKDIPASKDETIQYCTNLLMRHGKKARAEKLLARALYIVKLQLRVDPVVAFKEILEKMSPLMIVKTFKDGTAKLQHVPVPLGRRQRLRIAFGWIVTKSGDRRKKDFSVRLAEELVAAYNGTSKGFEYRSEMHKDAIQQRAYVRMK